MTTDPFLAAIIADPADDLPRLVYADWLDERGDPRGEFIRVQCELASFGPGIGLNHCCLIPATGGSCKRCENGVRQRNLLVRERELLRDNWGAWSEFVPENIVTRQCEYCEDGSPDWETGAIECRQCDSTGLLPTDDNIEFTRGFISALTCSAADWLRHADAITAATPLERVTLTTMPHWPNADNDQYLTNKRLYMTWPRIEFTLPEPSGTIYWSGQRDGDTAALPAEAFR